MNELTTIAERIAQVRAHIAAACDRAGRHPDAVTLVAVSKTHPPEVLLAALAAGVRHFGENRAEEAAAKMPVVNAAAAVPPVWHMIGHIQSRKAKLIPPLFQVVHSVDTLKLAQRLAEQVPAGAA
nr:alanine racemase [Anaerolineae bacterium]